MSSTPFSLAARRTSVAVDVGGVTVGGTAPIVVQSMTNTDTADAEGTAAQVAARFDGAPAARVAELLETLASLGQAEQMDDAHFVAG